MTGTEFLFRMARVPSNASRGAYFKRRTKQWLRDQGYQVGALEVVHWIHRGGRQIPVKRDQFGADIIAMNRAEILFVQVKGGKAAIGGTFPDARRKFAAFVFPPGARRIVIGWPPRARRPRIVECR